MLYASNYMLYQTAFEILSSTNALSPLALPTLPLAEWLVWEHPATNALSLALLAKLRLGDPRIFPKVVLAGESSRTADVHAPGAHALEWVLLREHMEIPEREAGGELDVASLGVCALSREADGRGGLEVAEDRDTILSVDSGRVNGCSVRRTTAANTEKLDLSHDEAVAAAVLAHDAVEMRKTLEVQDLLGW
jgi:hypothetical protein